MSGPLYSKDQIEQKRLLALKRKAEKESKGQNAGNGALLQDQRYGENLHSGKGAVGRLSEYRSSESSPTAKRRPPNVEHALSPLKAKNPSAGGSVLNGKCTMISESRFAVIITYNAQVLDLFRAIPSKNYDMKTRLWDFHISDHDKLIATCAPLRPNVIIEKIPRYTLQMLIANLNKKPSAEADLSRIDQRLRSSLFPFQREGILYGISRQGRCLIADDMGLGKTIQALGLAHYYKDDWPLIIIAPASVRYQWSEAIYKFLPSVPTAYVHHFTSGKDFVGSSKITIVTYDLLVRSIDVFERNVYGFVILDESHSVKNMKAARTKAVQRIAAQANRVVLLSGTPALSRPQELHSQISLVVPSFMGYYDYGQRYCNGVKKTFGWDFSGSSNPQELNVLLRACCMVRRLKVDVLQQLPSKIRQVVALDPALIPKKSKGLKKIADKLSNTPLSHSERHHDILDYYHKSSELRIKAVCSYISDLLERGEKFLIFAHHQTVLDEICELVESKKIEYIRIDGKTQSEQRKFQVDRFQESNDCLVAVLSITAANTGITLTAAQLVVFAELYWNPGVLCQAEDRVHRIGQTRGVVIQYLVGESTADDHIWPLIKKKINVLNEAGLDQNFTLNEAELTKHKESAAGEAETSTKKGQMKMDSFVTSQTPNISGANTSAEQTEFDDFYEDMDLEGLDLASFT